MLATPRGNGCPYSEHTTASTVALVSWLAFETTATVLSWTVLLLAQHPAILSDLADELSAHDSAAAGSAGLLSLPLLDAVVREAMRLITPVPVISFRMGANGEIAGQHFAENSRFYVLPFLTHRKPDLYPESDRFRPERWFSVKPSPYEYLPFGGGQRRCPGYWLAMVNLKVVLNEVLRRFRPSFPAGARVDRKYAVVLMPKSGVPIELVPTERYDRAKIVPSASGSIFDLFVPEPDRPVRH
jgi:cytochrome P450